MILLSHLLIWEWRIFRYFNHGIVVLWLGTSLDIYIGTLPIQWRPKAIEENVFGSDAKWFLSLERFRVQTFEWIGFAVESSLEFMVSVGVQNHIRPRINVILFCIYNV